MNTRTTYDLMHTTNNQTNKRPNQHNTWADHRPDQQTTQSTQLTTRPTNDPINTTNDHTNKRPNRHTTRATYDQTNDNNTQHMMLNRAHSNTPPQEVLRTQSPLARVLAMIWVPASLPDNVNLAQANSHTYSPLKLLGMSPCILLLSTLYTLLWLGWGRINMLALVLISGEYGIPAWGRWCQWHGSRPPAGSSIFLFALCIQTLELPAAGLDMRLYRGLWSLVHV